jgi:hypothetical protein
MRPVVPEAVPRMAATRLWEKNLRIANGTGHRTVVVSIATPA